MSRHEQLPELDELWKVKDRSTLLCYACGGTFEGEALIRTFRMNPSTTKAGQPGSGDVTVRDYPVVFCNWHIQCLSGIRYIAISHVWDVSVSEAQMQGPTTALKSTARSIIFESLERMRVALGGNLEQTAEVWYDYLSVPQWEDDLKLNILRAIPDVFANASFTFIHLDDVHSSAVDSLRHGTSSAARVSGITSICNAKWFKRVWTIMEFIRSTRADIMTSDGKIYPSDVLLQEVFTVWNEERERLGGIHALERLAGLGTNIVPWNLGPLQMARTHKKIDFGTAFSILSRRGCRSRSDFFHALLGILKADFQGALDEDPVTATLQIATKCLEAGDYSPLLMVPRPEPVDPLGLPELFYDAGYVDVLAFGLETSSGFPLYHSESTFGLARSQIKLEKIGVVEYAVKADGYDELYSYMRCAEVALHYTGPAVDEFVETVCARLYNLSKEHVRTVLSDGYKRSRLLAFLTQWYDDSPNFLFDEDSISRARLIAELLGLTHTHPTTHPHSTPIDFMFEHGGTLHNMNPATLIAARCSGCNRAFVYRAGLHRSPSEVKGSAAYRILGPKYAEARDDGLGILVKDGVITGRLLWASRACECRVAEMVDIQLQDLPLQRPRDEEAAS